MVSPGIPKGASIAPLPAASWYIDAASVFPLKTIVNVLEPLTADTLACWDVAPGSTAYFPNTPSYLKAKADAILSASTSQTVLE